MNTLTDKTPETSSNAIAGNLSKQQENGGSAFYFSDNRPEALAQRKLQKAANNSPRVLKSKSYQDMGSTGPIQRVVRQESGKWISSHDETRKFNTKQEAEEFEKTKTGKQVDIVKEVVLDKDLNKVKSDVNIAMKKIIFKIFLITKVSEDAARLLQKSGRDSKVYAPILSLLNYNMLGLLSKWNEKWSLEETAGLLLDISNAFVKFAPIAKNTELIMNEQMKMTRNSKTKRTEKDSELVKNLPPGAKTQAGVSASTGVLLKMIRFLNVNSPLEIEAIMNGVILYWGNSKLKQAMGDFHTAAEVWSAYTFHLENYVLSTENNIEWKSKL